MNLSALDTFRKTAPGYLVFGIIELALTYLFVSLAINSGSLWQWILTIILFVGSLQNFIKLIWSLVHGRKHTN